MKASKDLYRFKAVIDYIEIQFKTLHTSNGPSVKRLSGFSYVTPLDVSSGGSANLFQARLYDVAKWKEFEAQLTFLKKRVELESEPIITSVEVSFDAYSNGASQDDLIDYLVDYSRLLCNPISLNKRFSKGSRFTTIGIDDPAKIKKRMVDGGSIYFGNKFDPKKMLMYYKITDRNNQLPESERRSRVEITLSGNQCPFTSASEAKNFNFTKLMPYFRIRKLKEGLSGLDSVIADRSTEIGSRRLRHRIGGGSRLHSRLTIADVELNQIIYDQLRQLTNRLKTR